MSATITEARLEADRWSNDHGTFDVWMVRFEADGKTITAPVNRKVKDGESIDPTGLPVELKNGKWKVAPKEGGGSSGGGGGAKDYKADPVKLRAENRRSALHAAVARANAIGPDFTSVQIVEVAEIFWNWVEEGSCS